MSTHVFIKSIKSWSIVAFLCNSLIFSEGFAQQSICPLEWTDFTGVTTDEAGRLVKSSTAQAWFAGGTSLNGLEQGADGGVEFIIDRLSPDIYMLGLSQANTNPYYTSIDYALYPNSGVLHIYEKGIMIGTFGALSIEDVLRVERIGGDILYKKNGTIIRTKTVGSTQTLFADVSINAGRMPSVSTSFCRPLVVVACDVKSPGCNGESTGSINVTATGNLPISYAWSTGQTTNTISGLSPGTYSVTITDGRSNTKSYTYNVGRKTEWTDLVGATTDESGRLIKSPTAQAWFSGGISRNGLEPGADGGVEFVIDRLTPDIYMLGLAQSNTNAYFASIDYALYHNNGVLYIYENGVSIGTYGSLSIGDVLRVERKGGDIRYLKNGSVIRTKTIGSAQTLFADVSISAGTIPVISTSFCIPLVVSADVKSLNCNGESDGLINITATGNLPISYAWSNGQTTNTVSGLSPGAYSVTITDGRSNTKSYTYNVGRKTEWTDLAGATTDEAGRLIKSPTAQAWFSGGTSLNSLEPNIDGGLEFIINRLTPDIYMLGLAQANVNPYYTSIDYGLYHNNGVLYIYENGVSIGAFGPLYIGDVLRVERKGADIRYMKNGSVIRTKTVGASQNLFVDVSISAGTIPVVSTSFCKPLVIYADVSSLSCNGESTGSINAIATGNLPISYTWSNGQVTNSMSGLAQGAYSVTITDARSNTKSYTYNIGRKTDWTDLTGATIDEAGRIIRSDGTQPWYGGGTSWNSLKSGENGWMEFVVDRLSPDIFVIGLAQANAAPYYNSIDYGLHNSYGTLYIYEKGSPIGTFGSVAVGDVLRIERVGSEIRYLRNGAVLRTRNVNMTQSLYADVSVHTGRTPIISTSFCGEFPNVYTTGGGGTYCAASNDGSNIILSGSQQGINYQLKINGVNSGVPIIGTGSPLIWNNQRSVGLYTIVATNSSGVSQIMNGSASISMNQPPSGFSIEGGGIYCPNEEDISVSLDGSEMGINYQLKANGVNKGAPLSGTGNKLVWENLNSEGTYTVVATNPVTGCAAPMNGNAQIAFYTISLPVMSKEGCSVRLSMLQQGVTYKLYKDNVYQRGQDKTGDGVPVSWNGLQQGTYTVKAFSGCAIEMLPGSAIVGPADFPTPYKLSEGGSYCPGGSGFKLTLNGSQTGVSYQLKLNESNVDSPLNGTGAAMNWLGLNSEGIYTVVATNVSGCSQLMTGIAELQSYSMPQVFLTSGGGTYKGAESSIDIKLSNSEKGINYQLKLNGSNLGQPIKGTGAALSWSGQNKEGSYTVAAINSSTGCSILMNGSASIGADKMKLILDQLAFQYKYDARRRVIMKKIPGASWIYLVYDNRDRLVLTQDGNQRAASPMEWTFTKYDALNRPVLTGTYKDNESQDQAGMQQKVNDFYALASGNTDEWYEARGSAVHGYTNQSFPKVSAEGDYHTVTYYDDYSFKSLISNAAAFNYKNDELSDEGYSIETESSAKGEATATKIKNMEDGTWLWAVEYYDEDRRVIQSISANHLGGTDRVTNAYDFVHNLLCTKTSHIVGTTTTRVIHKFVYDHMNRLLQTWHKLNDEEEVLLSFNEYNELGQLITKSLHTTDEGIAQAVDYRYNIRGWLTRINNSDLNNNVDAGPRDYFGMELGYNNDIGIGTFTPRYNGNIAAMKWSSGLGLGTASASNPAERGYKFSYDPMNRMLNANHLVKGITWNPSQAFKETANYDLNGNISNLSRNNEKGTLLDGLIYNYGEGAYKSNRLLSVSDNGSPEGFADGNSNENDYTYDKNGNLILDKNKGISSIQYNTYLNQVKQIENSNGEKVKYIYNAEGIKLAQEIYSPGASVPGNRADYIGAFVYENNKLSSIQHEEGKIIIPDAQASDPSPEYQYQLKDQLNNVRLTFTTKEKIDEFKATMEDNGLTDYSNPRVKEEAYFGNLEKTEIRNVNQWLNHTSPAIGNACYLDGSSQKTIGPNTMLKVYPGDVVKMEVFGKYERNTSNNPKLPAAIVAAVLNSIQSTALIDGIPHLMSSSFSDALVPLVAAKGETGAVPAAYLNYILFDKEMNVIDLGFDRIDALAGFDPLKENTVSFDKMQLEKTIGQAGYLYVYVSNESQGARVWMDDLTITNRKSPIVQSEDYYPFGLSMGGTAFERDNDQYKGMVTSDGTGLKDLGFRNYDPVLGRFHSVDPLAELQLENSVYHYAENNPAGKVDLLGLLGTDYNGPAYEEAMDAHERFESAMNGYTFEEKKEDSNKQEKNENSGNSKKDKKEERKDKRTEKRRVNGKKVKVIYGQGKYKAGRTKSGSSNKTDNQENSGNSNQDNPADDPLVQMLFKGLPKSRSSHEPQNNHLAENHIETNQFMDFEAKPDMTDVAMEHLADELDMPVRQSYTLAQNAANLRRLKEQLHVTLPLNEARALYGLALTSRNDNHQSRVFKQSVKVLADQPSGAVNNAGKPPLSNLTIQQTQNGRFVGVSSKDIQYQKDDGLNVSLRFDFEVDVVYEGENEKYTVEFSSLGSSDEFNPDAILLNKAKEYAERYIIQPSYDNSSETRPYSDIDRAVQEVRKYLAIGASQQDVLNYAGTYEQGKNLEESVEKFRDEQGIDSRAIIVDKETFDHLKEEYESGRLKSEKDVTVIMGKKADGTFDKYIAYKEDFFHIPTQKVVDGQTIQLKGTAQEIADVRDHYIDKAIENNDIEGVGDIEDPAENIFEKAMWVIKVTKTLLDDVEIKEQYWNSDLDNPLPFDVPDPLAGAGNVAIDELKSIPDMLSMGLSLFDKEARDQLIKLVSELNWDQVKEGLKGMFDDKIDNYNSGNIEKVQYQASADGATIVIMLLEGGGKLITKLKDVFSNVKKLSKIDWKSINLPKAKAKQLSADISENKVLRDAVIDDPKLAKAWEALEVDDVLRSDPETLKKFTKHLDDSGDDINKLKDEFNKLTPDQRKGWIEHFDKRTVHGKVKSAGGNADKYGKYGPKGSVPSRYSDDPRFDNLSKDPAHQGGPKEVTSKTRQEAMAGLEAEGQGLVKKPISRGPEEIEFYDGNGSPWDVKGPRGDYFNVDDIGSSIKDELNKAPFANKNTGVPEARKIILDTSYISDAQLNTLRTWLKNNLSSNELGKIIEVNSNLN